MKSVLLLSTLCQQVIYDKCRFKSSCQILIVAITLTIFNVLNEINGILLTGTDDKAPDST